MKTAVVTGASSGLGTEYLKQIVAFDHGISEIWIIARRADRLDALAKQFSSNTLKITVLPLDLSSAESFALLRARLSEANPDVSILVNNAGFGVIGDVDAMSVESQCSMIDLNCRALTAVTSAVLPYMSEGSFIINVSSIASFAPTPRMTVYSSTKAYVTSFSKSLREELKKKHINVTAVCPGPMDTEFLGIAGIEKGTSHTFDTLPRCSPEKIALLSLRKAAHGKAVCTGKLFYKFYRLLAKLLPHSLIMKISKT